MKIARKQDRPTVNGLTNYKHRANHSPTNFLLHKKALEIERRSIMTTPRSTPVENGVFYLCSRMLADFLPAEALPFL